MDLGREEGQEASARGQANPKKGNRGAAPYWFILKKNRKEGTFRHHYHCDRYSLFFQVRVLI